jgi:hypothetical protein
MKIGSGVRKFGSLVCLLGIAALMGMTEAESAGDWLKTGGDLLKQAAGRSSGPQTAGETALASGEIAAGLKEALRVGSGRVVDRLGAADGFNADPKVRIPLPGSLQTVHQALSRVGMGGLTEDLELRLNRAAEAAAPKARDLFVDAISQMTIEDAQAIWKGPPDAATRYFEGKMSTPLAAEMRPVVEESLTEAGAVQVYDQAMGRYRSLPFVPDLKTDLTGHVVDGALAGIFTYLAEEEAAIRSNPAKRSTELLQKVFGAAD